MVGQASREKIPVQGRSGRNGRARKKRSQLIAEKQEPARVASGYPPRGHRGASLPDHKGTDWRAWRRPEFLLSEAQRRHSAAADFFWGKTGRVRDDGELGVELDE